LIQALSEVTHPATASAPKPIVMQEEVFTDALAKARKSQSLLTG
jgi:hypothetical protein